MIGGNMLQALRDTIIILPIYEERKGNIIIPLSNIKYKKYDGVVYGKVISIGPKFEKRFGSNALNVGDLLIWQRNEGKRIEFNRRTYYVVKSKWVMGVMNDRTS